MCGAHRSVLCLHPSFASPSCASQPLVLCVASRSCRLRRRQPVRWPPHGARGEAGLPCCRLQPPALRGRRSLLADRCARPPCHTRLPNLGSSSITPHAKLRACAPPAVREDHRALAQRGYEFLAWLKGREEKEIAVGTHSAFLFALLNVAVVTDEAERGTGVASWFAAGEMRSVWMWFEDGTTPTG